MLVEFPNLYDNFTIPYPDWNHLDFMWAIDTDVYFFPRILENMAAAENLGKSEDTRMGKSEVDYELDERMEVMKNVLEELLEIDNVEDKQ